MDLQTMRDYVRRIQNEEGESDGYYSDTELNSYINEAYRALVREFPANHIQDIFELAGSQSTSTATGDISLPSDYDRLISVKYDDVFATVVSYLTQDLLDDDPWYAATATEPITYINGSTLYIRPVPSSTITAILRYIKIPAELSEDGDTPEVREVFHEMICFGAIERAKTKDNEFDEAGYFYSRMKKKMYRYYNEYMPEEKLRQK